MRKAIFISLSLLFSILEAQDCVDLSDVMLKPFGNKINSPISLENIHIDTALILKDSTLLFTSPLKIKKSLFAKGLDLSRQTFTGPVRLVKSQITGTLSFWESTFQDELYIGNDVCFNSINLNHARINSPLRIKNFTLTAHNQFKMMGTYLNSDTIELNNIVLESKLDFSGGIYPNKQIVLQLRNVDISQLNLDYSHFVLDTCFMSLQKEYFYQQILRSQKELGYLNGIQKIDIEYKAYKYSQTEFGPVLNWLEKNWWNYGYNKEWTITGTLKILGTFILITTFLFGPLHTRIYPMDFIKEHYQSATNSPKSLLRPIIRLYFGTIYTTTIFFGLKLDFEKLNLKSILSLYIFLVYLSGLVCIGFLMHYIIFP